MAFSELQQVAQLVAERCGLYFPAERAAYLESGVRRRMQQRGCARLGAYVGMLLEQPAELDALADQLTIGETYFFRDRNQFEALERDILPGLVHRRRATTRTLRIWSAACSTGEEAYSLAIALRRLLPDHEGWQPALLATDINRKSIEQAQRGVYREWSFRDTPAELREQWFTREGPGWRIRDDVRRLVQFEMHNLVESPPPATGPFDVILCRNVMIYFHRDTVARVMQHLRDALCEGGWLFVGASEVGPEPCPGLEQVALPGTFAYRKTQRGGSDGAAVDPAAIPEPMGGLVPAAAAAEDPAFGFRTAAPLGPPVRIPRRPAIPERHPAVACAPPEAAAAPTVQSGSDPVADASTEPRSLLEEARELANAGDLDAAIARCQRALEADASCAPCHFLAATLHLAAGRHREALHHLRNACFLQPDLHVARFTLADLQARIGDPASARRNFEQLCRSLQEAPPRSTLAEGGGIQAGRLLSACRRRLAELGG